LDNKLTLIKLGGSIITNKKKPLSANKNAIKRLARVIFKIKTPLILIHGGGSFGHYWSVKFDMHTKPEKYSPNGISIVHSSMLDLNKIVTEILKSEKLHPYSIPPVSLLIGGRPSIRKIKELQTMTEHNIIPITFGDIVHIKENKYSIISGDVLMTILSTILKPSKVIFATNVDGLYNNLGEKKIIREIDVTQFNIEDEVIKTKELHGIDDVTGGMKRKLEEAIKIGKQGTDVIFINGLYPSNLENVFTDKKFKGTIFKGKN
jgi:isopentenyl phosphate kinase